MNAETVQARSAIESLRSGVPSRYAVAQLGTTQQEVRDSFEGAMAAVAAGEAIRPITIAANFGAGKSHLLNYLQSLAERQNFVSSLVVVSPEMPLGKSHLVLKAIADSSRAPGRMGQALRALTPEFSSASTEFAQLRAWTRDSDLNGRFAAMLHIYEEYRGDQELRAQILDDLEGKPLLKTEIRRKLKEMGELAAYDLSGPKTTLLAHDRIRLLAQFYRACGCQGLVVLVDEVERVAKFSSNQRAAAYQELGWWHEVATQAGSGILPVFAMTENFVEFVKRDSQRFFTYTPNAAYEQDPRDRRTSQGLETLKMPLLLQSSPDQDEEIKYRIKGIYERAYALRVPNLPPRRNEIRTTIRSQIRKWITLWDFYRHDPEYAPQMEEEALVFDTAEISDEEIPPDDTAE